MVLCFYVFALQVFQGKAAQQPRAAVKYKR